MSTPKSLKHKFVTTIPDGADPTLMRGSNWNDDHAFFWGYNAQTGTSYVLDNADQHTLITFKQDANVIVSLPQPALLNNFLLGWNCYLRNEGRGTVTLTPTNASIDGAATLAIGQDQSTILVSDGVNWHTIGAAGTDLRVTLEADQTYYVRTPPQVATISIATPGVVTANNHGLSVNDPIVISCLPYRTLITITPGSPATFNATAHPFVNGDPVNLFSTGVLPAGFAFGTKYYVVNAAANTFQLAATVGGLAINTTADGQFGAHYCEKVGTLPTGLTLGTVYYAINVTTNTFQLAAVAGGTAINTTGTQEGTFVIQTGNDANSGLNNGRGGALLTPQRAMDLIQLLDLAGHAITVQVADGLYTGTGAVVSTESPVGSVGTNPTTGTNTIYFVGNSTYPGNVWWQRNNITTVLVCWTAAYQFTFQYIRLDGGKGADLRNGANVIIQDHEAIISGTGGLGYCYAVDQHSTLVVGRHAVQGNCSGWVTVANGSLFSMANINNVKFLNKPVFALQTVKAASGALATLTGIAAFDGVVSGKKFDISGSAIITTFDTNNLTKGLAFIPGDVAGTLGSGAYDNVVNGVETIAADRTVYVRTTPSVVTISNATPAVVTWSAHGLRPDDPVVFTCLPNMGTVTIATGTPGVITKAAHGWANGTPVKFHSTGVLPAGITAGTKYYVVGAATDTFNVEATVGGGAIALTGNQWGTHYVEQAGTLPTGLSDGVAYYVSRTGYNLNNFQLAATVGGASIATTGAGEGVFVAQTGNDLNDGSGATRTGALLTHAQAFALGQGLNLKGYTLFIQMADGRHNRGLYFKDPAGAGTGITVKGNQTFPSNVWVNGSALNGNGVWVGGELSGTTAFNVQWVRLEGWWLCYTEKPLMFLPPMEYISDGSDDVAVWVNRGQARLIFDQTAAHRWMFSAAHRQWLKIQRGGQVLGSNTLHHFLDNPTFTYQTVFAESGGNGAFYGTMEGRATGQRFLLQSDGRLTTSFDGTTKLTFFPGNAIGSNVGGTYDNQVNGREKLLAVRTYYVRTAPASVTISNATPAVVSWTAHGLKPDDPVVFSNIANMTTFTVTIASPGVVTQTAHGYAAGQPIKFYTTGALPTGLSVNTVYYVVNDANLTANTYAVSATSGGAAINTSGVQSGTHYVERASTLPTGVTEGTIYYVIAAGWGVNSFQFSATVGGAAVNTSAAQAGLVYAQTGDDVANDGLAQTAGRPWLTAQAAMDFISSALDTNGQTVTVQLADGTYTAANQAISFKPLTGQGQAKFLGNQTTPSNVLLTSPSLYAVYCSGALPNGSYTLQGVRLRSTWETAYLFGINISFVYTEWVMAGSNNAYMLFAQGRSQASFSGTYKVLVTGTCAGIMNVVDQSLCYQFGSAPTFLDTPAFGAATVQCTNLAYTRVAWQGGGVVGTATGTRYNVIVNAVIDTAGGGAAYIPGSVAGTAATGGQYI